MLKDFKAFITKGPVVDMAVGIIIGAAFGTIVSSMVKDVIMPPIGLALGKIDFVNLLVVIKQGSPTGPYASLADAQKANHDVSRYINFAWHRSWAKLLATTVKVYQRRLSEVVEFAILEDDTYGSVVAYVQNQVSGYAA